MSTVSCPASWYDCRVTSIVSWLDDITIIPHHHCLFHQNTLWMTFTGCRLQSEKWGTSFFHNIVFFRVNWMGSLSTLQVFELELVSPVSVFTVDTLSLWCVGSHICSDVSSVYLSVPSLSGGGLREGNALSGSNIKYIKWERMGGGGGGVSPSPPPSMGPGGCIVSGSLSVTVSL